MVEAPDPGVGSASASPQENSSLFPSHRGGFLIASLVASYQVPPLSQVRNSLSAFSGDELESVMEKVDRVSQAFTVEEEADGESVTKLVRKCHWCFLCLRVVLDDDSSQLGEVQELFSDITIPLKVGKLIKVNRFTVKLVWEGGN